MTDLNSEVSSTEIVRSWAEKNGFADWGIAVLWLIMAFILFQVTAGLVFVGLMIAGGKISSTTDVQSVMMDHLDLLFIGNSTGQILFLGLATFLVTRLHLSGEGAFSYIRLKWNEDTTQYVLYGAILVIVVQPIVLYLGFLNSLFPIPDSLTDMQVSQYEMFAEFLKQDQIVLFGLLNIALVPAFCEEILFRGYILKSFEKSWGVIKAIIISGLIFGFFHLQLPNLLPLASLGVVLALMTWLSGSIWPAIVAHFLNNGAAVILATSYPELAFNEMTAETLPPVWILIISILFTTILIRYMMSQSKETQ